MAAAAGLFLINIWPGWEQLSFLTEDTIEVLWIVNAALLASTVADLISLAYDPPWLVAFGGVVTTGIGLIALIRFAQARFWVNVRDGKVTVMEEQFIP